MAVENFRSRVVEISDIADTTPDEGDRSSLSENFTFRWVRHLRFSSEDPVLLQIRDEEKSAVIERA
jgi:hypothetical protein